MTGAALSPSAHHPARTRRAVSIWDAAASARGAGVRRAVGTMVTFLHLRRRDLTVLVPVLVSGMALNVLGLVRFPRFSEAEGALVAGTYGVEGPAVLGAGGDLDRLSPWGALQLAGWMRLTQAIEEPAVPSGRVLMMLALAVSAVLLWALVRRLELPRVVAAAAVLLFLVAPLAIQVHRSVALENLATAWILAAFVLATARSRQLLPSVLGVLAAVAASLTSVAFLPLVPFVVWMIVRTSRLATRRYTLATAGTVLVLAAAAYPVAALLAGNRPPTTAEPSLLATAGTVLRSLTTSGAPTDPRGPGAQVLAEWFALSPTLLLLGGVAMLLGLGSHTLRPFAAALIALTALLTLGPDGEIAPSRIVAMLPLLAVVVPGVVWQGWRRFAVPVRARSPRVTVVAVGLLTVAALTVPYAAAPWRTQVSTDADAPRVSALAWIEDGVPRDQRVVADDAFRVGLYEAGFALANVVGYTEIDGGASASSDSWQDIGWVVVTDPVREAVPELPNLGAAIASSTLVAAFGEQDERVEIRRVDPDGFAAAEQEDGAEAAARAAFGSLLAGNPNLVLAQGADALAAGMLDPRAQLLLADLASRGEVSVADLPEIAGEEGLLRRTVVLTALDGEPLDFAGQRAVLDRLDDLPPGWEPSETEQDIGSLTLVWSLSPPAGLLPDDEP